MLGACFCFKLLTKVVYDFQQANYVPFKNLVDNLDVDVLRRLAAELLRRQPAVFADLVNGELPDEPQPGVVHPKPDPDQPQPADAPQPAADVP